MTIPQKFSQEKLSSLLQNAFNKRKRLLNITNAIRLVNGQGDGLKGLVIDRYHSHYMVQVYDDQWASRLEEIKKIILDEEHPEFLIFKETSSEKSDQNSFYRDLTFMQASSKTIVAENGLKFEVDLDDGINAGLFLDMRANRQKIREIVKGKEVLNCFAYTCSFGVYARAGGALRVVNVDISQKALDKGKKNYELNHLSLSENEFVKMETIEYLERAIIKKNVFDVVIIDPPSFARYDGKVFSVREKMGRLIEFAMRILKPSGYLLIATNFSEFSLTMLENEIKDRLRFLGKKIKQVDVLGQDSDFRGSGTMKESYLAAVLINLV